MLQNPANKYPPFAKIDMPDRQWPNNSIQHPPIWLSTDLRDGNQALFEPMNISSKLALFKELVQIGFKEIEVGFPAASQMDYDFVRQLIDQNQLPDDVTPMVMTQAREDLIRRSVESLKGARRAIVHIYNATAPLWRDVVFGMSVNEVMGLIEKHVLFLKTLTDAQPETEWVLQYSPETFSMTELDVSLMACNTAIRAWGTGAGRQIIINLPTTVENTTPNVFADQIEWMHRHLDCREHVILSVHTHNDRGTGVAAAELAQLAGAQRVEGCLFGNGERSGNVDLVTLALNLYTQGVHPQLDFSDINRIARVVEQATKLPIHPRHPYVGDLVFTAFSGSHQDAIKKGFAAQQTLETARWSVPYLPIDPADIGRTYESVIRVNSQSGKGGIAYLLERDYGVVMPRRMQIEFSNIVQRVNDTHETEITAAALWALFQQTYLGKDSQPNQRYRYQAHRLFDDVTGQAIEIDLLDVDRQTITRRGVGSGPIDATVHALDISLEVLAYEERAVGTGANAQALAIVEVFSAETQTTRFGAGLHQNIITASVMAVINAAGGL